MSGKLDLTITWASGSELCGCREFQCYLRSLSACGFQGDRLVFSHDIPQEARARCNALGFLVVDVAPHLINIVVRDRFLAFWNFLARHIDRYRYVIMTDAKDVAFQRNPIPYLEQFSNQTGEFVVFVAEGMRHEQSEWNLLDQLACQKQLPYFVQDFTKWEVFNAGTIMGTAARIRDLCFLIWSCTLFANLQCTDQAVLNFLHSFLAEDKSNITVHPADSALVLTGAAVKEKLINPEPIVREGQFLHPTLHEPYCLVHQWERTEHREAVAARYLGS